MAWHGSSSKMKSEMLAAQSRDGDLRVWSVPKTHAQGDNATVIRVLNKLDSHQPGPCWFNWSKNGRIVQYCDGFVQSFPRRCTLLTCTQRDPVVGCKDKACNLRISAYHRRHRWTCEPWTNLSALFVRTQLYDSEIQCQP